MVAPRTGWLELRTLGVTVPGPGRAEPPPPHGPCPAPSAPSAGCKHKGGTQAHGLLPREHAQHQVEHEEGSDDDEGQEVEPVPGVAGRVVGLEARGDVQDGGQDRALATEAPRPFSHTGRVQV